MEKWYYQPERMNIIFLIVYVNKSVYQMVINSITNKKFNRLQPEMFYCI